MDTNTDGRRPIECTSISIAMIIITAKGEKLALKVYIITAASNLPTTFGSY